MVKGQILLEMGGFLTKQNLWNYPNNDDKGRFWAKKQVFYKTSQNDFLTNSTACYGVNYFTDTLLYLT